MTCINCRREIEPGERSETSIWGTMCETCLDAAERCAPDPEPEYEPYHYPQP